MKVGSSMLSNSGVMSTDFGNDSSINVYIYTYM